MNGPNRSGNRNNMNNRNNKNKKDGDKKRPALSFLSIVLWAVILVMLLNTCSSSLKSASTQEVEYSEFKNWIAAGYVDHVELGDSCHYFTLKEGSAPLQEYAEQLKQTLGDKNMNMLQQLVGNQQLSASAVTFVTAAPGSPPDNRLYDLMDANGVHYFTKLVSKGP